MAIPGHSSFRRPGHWSVFVRSSLRCPDHHHGKLTALDLDIWSRFVLFNLTDDSKFTNMHFTSQLWYIVPLGWYLRSGETRDDVRQRQFLSYKAHFHALFPTHTSATASFLTLHPTQRETNVADPCIVLKVRQDVYTFTWTTRSFTSESPNRSGICLI